MRKSDRIGIESVQRSFTKRLIGWSSPLTYKERCLFFKLDPLWLRRMKLNLIFLYNIPHSRTYTSNPLHFAPVSNYPLRSGILTLSTPITNTSLRSHFFITVYSNLWNKLPLEIRSSTSSHRLRSALDKFLTVTQTLQLLNVDTR